MEAQDNLMTEQEVLQHNQHVEESRETESPEEDRLPTQHEAEQSNEHVEQSREAEPPTEDRLPTYLELRVYNTRMAAIVREIQKVGGSPATKLVVPYIQKTFSVKAPNFLTVSQWDTFFDTFDELDVAGKIRELDATKQQVAAQEQAREERNNRPLVPSSFQTQQAEELKASTECEGQETAFAKWLENGKTIVGTVSHTDWLLGDWLISADPFKDGFYDRDKRLRAPYDEAAELTGISVPALRNIVYVCRAIKPSFRNDALSFTHHMAVARLDSDKQKELLDEAATAGLSVAEFRKRVGFVSGIGHKESSPANQPRPKELRDVEKDFALLAEYQNTTTKKLKIKAYQNFLNSDEIKLALQNARVQAMKQLTSEENAAKAKRTKFIIRSFETLFAPYYEEGAGLFDWTPKQAIDQWKLNEGEQEFSYKDWKIAMDVTELGKHFPKSDYKYEDFIEELVAA